MSPPTLALMLGGSLHGTERLDRNYDAMQEKLSDDTIETYVRGHGFPRVVFVLRGEDAAKLYKEFDR